MMTRDEAIENAKKYIRCRGSNEGFCKRHEMCEGCPNDYGDISAEIDIVESLLREVEGCK